MSTRFRIGPTTFNATIALWERLIRGGGPVSPAPINTVQPFITGDLFVGETLTCNPGVWWGAPYPTFTYQWRIWNGTGWDDIVGATNETYVPLTDDDYQCLVTGTNVHDAVTAESDTVDVEPALEAPTYAVAPSITSDTTEIGATLTADEGVWNGNPAPTITLQWQIYDSVNLEWDDIVGETALTYVTEADGEYRIEVTATNSEGFSVEYSNTIVIGTAVIPENLVIPQVSGNAYVGSTLYVIPGTWSEVDSFGYQWQTQNTVTSEWSDLVGETGTSYVTVSAVPHRCVVTGTNTSSSATANSNTLSVSEIPVTTEEGSIYFTSFLAAEDWVIPASCSISGGAFNFDNTTSNVTAGKDITSYGLSAGTYTILSTLGAGDPGDGATRGNVSFRFNNGTYTQTEPVFSNTTGAVEATIVAGAAPTELEIRVTRNSDTMNIKVLDIDLRGQIEVESLQAPDLDYAPQIRGTLETGETLYATHAVWFSNPEPSYTFQWYYFDDDTATWGVAPGTSTNFTYVPSEPGDYRVTVGVSNSEGTSSSTSASVTVTGEGGGGGNPDPGVGTYSEFRLIVDQTWGAPTVSIAEISFRATVGGASIAHSSVYGSTETFPATDAFDSDTGTWWNSAAGDTTPALYMVPTAASDLAQVAITYPVIEDEYYEEAPMNFRIQGWNGFAWITIITEEAAVWTPGETRTYTP